MQPIRPLLAVTAASAVLAVAAPAFGGTFKVTTLDQPGFNQNMANLVNDSDTVIGYSYNTSGSFADWRSFVWRNGLLTNKVKGQLEGINNKNVASGYYEPNVAIMGDTYNVAKNKFTFLKLNKKWFTVEPININNSGTLVGIAGTEGQGQHGFIQQGKVVTLLDSPDAPPASTGAETINDAGLVAGFWHEATANNYVHSFFYNQGTYTSADVAGSIETGILYLNNSGDYAGRYTLPNGNWVGFSVIGGTLTSYTNPKSVKYNEARGIGPNGEVVGWWSDANTTHGFLNIKGKNYNYDVPGSAGTYIAGINALGSIVGTYFDKSFNTHAFIAQCPAGQTPCTQ